MGNGISEKWESARGGICGALLVFYNQSPHRSSVRNSLPSLRRPKTNGRWRRSRWRETLDFRSAVNAVKSSLAVAASVRIIIGIRRHYRRRVVVVVVVVIVVLLLLLLVTQTIRRSTSNLNKINTAINSNIKLQPPTNARFLF